MTTIARIGPNSPTPREHNTLALTKLEPELLLLIFIHGFKGTDKTFAKFPERLEHVLSETIPHIKVESLIFPAYETKGELDKAVVSFADWLATLTVGREVSAGLGAGKANIVLCGHSMGGLLAADTLRELVRTRPDKNCPLWPKIIACIAYDTPFYGVHPFVVKHSVTKVAEHANAMVTLGSALLGSVTAFGAKGATQPPSPSQPAQSSWSRWAGPAAYAVGGALLAGGAYYKKDDLTQGLAWATDHMQYVGSLFDEASLDQRVDALIDIEKEQGVIFRTLYTNLPPNPPEFLTSRTFVVLPKYGSRSKAHFSPANNGLAPDEIQAHTGMFSASTNDGYYELGLSSAKIIRDAVLSSRGVVKTARASSPSSPTSPMKSPRRARSPKSPRKETEK